MPDKTDDIATDAYIIVEVQLSNIIKRGRIELCVWKTKAYREAGKRVINIYNILVGETEIVNAETGYLEQLAYADLAWKTGTEIYTKLKEHKFLVDGVEVDLSTATDEV
jgi:hypothetical protein